jgi:hypothetical protein
MAGMSAAPLQFLLLVFAGWVNRRRREIIESLQEENRVLREQIGPAPALHRRPTPPARGEGQAVGRRTLDQLAGLVTPDTILR